MESNDPPMKKRVTKAKSKINRVVDEKPEIKVYNVESFEELLNDKTIPLSNKELLKEIFDDVLKKLKDSPEQRTKKDIKKFLYTNLTEFLDSFFLIGIGPDNEIVFENKVKNEVHKRTIQSLLFETVTGNR